MGNVSIQLNYRFSKPVDSYNNTRKIVIPANYSRRFREVPDLLFGEKQLRKNTDSMNSDRKTEERNISYESFKQIFIIVMRCLCCSDTWSAC